VQQSVSERLKIFTKHKVIKLNLCAIIESFYLTKDGRKILDEDKNMLRNYEDSFKIAARVALNSMDMPDD
jgi:hypothetical protein